MNKKYLSIIFAMVIFISFTEARVTCKSLSTCEEACLALANGHTALDRDKDGIPCESLCSSPCNFKKDIPAPKKQIEVKKSSYTSSNILLNKFFTKKQCDQILENGGYFKTCYNYKMKGANFVSYTLDKNSVDKGNIKKRPQFYEDKNIPKQYRSHSNDYIKNRYKNDRGHLAPDAAFDNSQRSLKSVYVMSNIIPQHNSINRSAKAWKGLEKFARVLTHKIGKVSVLNGVDYGVKPKRIGRNQIAVPKAFWKILYNDKKNYQRCFYFENKSKDKTKKISDYQVDCKKLIQNSLR